MNCATSCINVAVCVCVGGGGHNCFTNRHLVLDKFKMLSANAFILDKPWIYVCYSKRCFWQNSLLALSKKQILDALRLKEFADDIFKFDENKAFPWKTLWEEEKLLVMRNFSFSCIFLAPLAIGQWAYVMVCCPLCVRACICQCVRPSVCPSVRVLTFSLNIFFSETTYRILMKFHRNVPAMVLFRISWKNLIPSKTVVVMATKLKKIWKLWKSSCQKPYGLQLPNLLCSFN